MVSRSKGLLGDRGNLLQWTSDPEGILSSFRSLCAHLELYSAERADCSYNRFDSNYTVSRQIFFFFLIQNSTAGYILAELIEL